MGIIEHLFEVDVVRSFEFFPVNSTRMNYKRVRMGLN